MKDLISHSATIFPVKDPLKSAQYYRDKLGFDITFTWDEPPSYVVTKLGESVSIHFVQRRDELTPSNTHVAMMLFVHNVDQVYEKLVENEVEVINPIGNRDYGMRDFDIRDPDGYILSFGMGIDMND